MSNSVAEALKANILRVQAQEKECRRMERRYFFPSSPAINKLVHSRLESLLGDIELFQATVTSPQDSVAAQRITKKVEWGLKHLRDPRGAWRDDPHTLGHEEARSSSEMQQNRSQQKQQGSTLSPQPTAGPEQPGGPPSQLTLAEVTAGLAAGGPDMDSELYRRIAKLTAVEVVVSISSDVLCPHLLISLYYTHHKRLQPITAFSGHPTLSRCSTASFCLTVRLSLQRYSHGAMTLLRGNTFPTFTRTT